MKFSTLVLLALCAVGCARGHRVHCSRVYTGTYNYARDQSTCPQGACPPICVVVPQTVTTTVTATGCVPHETSMSDALFRCDQVLQDQYDRRASGANFTPAQVQALQQAGLLNASTACPQPQNPWPDWQFRSSGDWVVNDCASSDPGPWWNH
jgi:hypothetical protein